MYTYALPDNIMTQSGNVKKYMTGNPFPYGFNLNDLYFKHQGNGYLPMGDAGIDSYIASVVYTHDSADTSDKDVASGGGYVGLDPSTPGFDTGSVRPMEGFFIKIKENSDQGANSFAFPLNQSNQL